MNLTADYRKIKKYFKIAKFIIFYVVPLVSITCFVILISSIFSILSDYDDEDSSSSGSAIAINIPEGVSKHKETIINYMRKYGVPDEYLPYILAQATQESYGKGVDIFQASESKYNGRMGMIKSVDESIDHAMKRWAEIIADIERKGILFSVELVLQTYNFGSGYLDWVKANGNKYTPENARSFSEHKLKTLKNWNYPIYGDIKYVEHVFRYLQLDNNYGDRQGLSNGTISFVINESKKYLNIPYLLGGNNPPYCLDCSSFTMRVYQKVNINFPHHAQSQYNMVTQNGTKIKRNIKDLVPGDLVFFKGTYNTSDYITHVGIYIGNGKMINAQVPRVMIADLNLNHWKYSFVGGGSPWHLMKKKP